MPLDLFEVVAVVRPTRAETLLLRACLLEGTAGREAWEAWRAGLDDPADAFRGPRSRLRALGPLLDASLRRNRADTGSRKLAMALRAAGAREELREAALRRAAADTLGRLRADGSEPVVLKGAALADSVYPNPALRHTHDLDLLDAEDRPAGRDIHPSGLPVNLHQHLFRVPFHRDAEPAMRGRVVPVEVADTAARTLAADDALVHLCAHAYSLGGANVAKWVPDAWFLLRRARELDWARLVDTVRRGRLAIQLSCLLGYLRDELGAHVPGEAIDELERDGRGAGPAERDVALAGAWAAPRRDGLRTSAGRRRALTLARWAVAPSPGYLRAGGKARGSAGLARAYVARPLRALHRRARHVAARRR